MYTKVLLSVLYCTDDRVPSELKKAIVQARNDKKLTQSQLAQVQLSIYLKSFSDVPDFLLNFRLD